MDSVCLRHGRGQPCQVRGGLQSELGLPRLLLTGIVTDQPPSPRPAGHAILGAREWTADVEDKPTVGDVIGPHTPSVLWASSL